jgi:phosphoribosylaminoimidazole-succinocarboxamide synthase
VVPFECVVRGYLSGSAWKEYRATGAVCGIRLPEGLVESDRLPEPIFTPATKAETGHDENVPLERMAREIGVELAHDLARSSIALYRAAREHAESRGLILADTKFEWGFAAPVGGPADEYRPGGPQPSFDKQFVRDWLERSGWDKNSPPPPLPEDVAAQTREKYVECYERLTGQRFGWN